MLSRLTFLLPLLIFARLEAQTPAVMTLAEAFQTVERVNVNVLLSRESVVQALEVANQQRSDLIPSVSASLSQRRSQSASISNTNRSRGATANRFDGRLVGSMNLLSPQQIAQYRAAQAGVRVAELDLQQTIQSIYAAVAQTYFVHLRNVRRRDVLDRNYQRALELVNLAKNRSLAGVGLDIDLTRAEAQLAIAEQARIQQESTIYQSELLFKRLLDLEPDRPLTVENFEVRRVKEETLPAVMEQTAFEQRADYLRARQALEQNRLFLRSVAVERFGALTMSGDIGYANRVIFDEDDQRAWSAGFAYSVPVFDAFRIRANERIALSQIRSQEFRLRQLELLISSELRLASKDAQSRFLQVGVAEKSLQLAEMELSQAVARFRAGDADNREVVDAQVRLAQANDNMNEAIFLYNLSRLEFARARGDVRKVLDEQAR